MKSSLLIVIIICYGIACSQVNKEEQSHLTPKSNQNNMTEKIDKSSKEWQECLSPESYNVLRKKGTERAFSGKFYKHKEKGIYVCAGCGNELFNSNTKYESGSGWPSFYDRISKDKIEEERDSSIGMLRIEIKCSKCGGHLGHVFDDGPNPTGLRYCVNSASLDFKKKEE